jgi:gliding motility-associated-like protein
VVVCTRNGGCDSIPVIIIVTPVNDPPVAIRDNASTLEDTPVTIGILGNDSDIDGVIVPTSVSIIDQPNHGTVVVNSNGTIDYTPNTNYTGVDTLIYNVCDNGLPVLCDTALVVINITPVNDPPVANQDTATTPYNACVVINVVGNDIDLDGVIDLSTVTLQVLPSNGTATVNANGSITYCPTIGFSGTDTLIYQVCDNGMPVLCDTAYVIVNVGPGNIPPVAVVDYDTTLEDTPVIISILSNDSDPDGQVVPSTVSVVSQPTNGTVVVNQNGTITYSPNTNWNGTDTFIYNVCDNGTPSLCDTAIVYVVVSPVNDPPIANVDHASTPENVCVNINILGNDIDIDGVLDSTSITITAQATNGIATVNSNGTITYCPNNGYSGADTLIYQVCDNGMPVLCDTALVIINVSSLPNVAPIANRDDETTPFNTSTTFNILSNDNGTDDGLSINSVTIVDQPNHGTVVYNSDSTITYAPNTGFTGVDTLVYQVCDNGVPQLCDTALVVIVVDGPINTPPIAIIDRDTTSMNTAITVSILSNDSDADNGLDIGSVTITDQPSNGSVIVNANGTINYIPNTGFFGNDTLVYQVCDNGVPILCDTAIVIITINYVNNEPLANNDNAFTCEGTPVSINVLSNDSDGDGTLVASSVEIISNPINGSVVNNLDGTITYSPVSGFNGVDSLTYNVMDNSGDTSNIATVVINVGQAPIATISSNGPTTICQGSSVTLTANVGVSYIWNNGETTQSIVVDSAGTYCLTVVYGGSCSSQACITVNVVTPQPPVITTSGSTVICVGDSVTLTSSNASNYLWSNGATTQSIVVSANGQYSVSTTDANGCQASSTPITVLTRENPFVNAGPDVVVCGPSNVTLLATVTQGGFITGYSWNNGVNTSLNNVQVTTPGTTIFVVTASNGFCPDQTDTVLVTVAETPDAAFVYSGTSFGNPTNFTDLSTGNNLVSWLWNFGDGYTSVSQNAYHTYESSDTFVVTLTVTNAFGCVDSTSQTLGIEQVVTVPNSFTPNGDGNNDILWIQNNGAIAYGITIFNRWGQQVYVSEGREIRWDGKTNAGVDLEMGTYYYVLKVNGGLKGDFEKTGFISLFR